MTDSPRQDWISSKKILEITGISRATLNNYIRLGLLPRPALAKPQDTVGGPKRIGYFPPSALSRVEEIRQLKQSGKTIDQIVDILAGPFRHEQHFAATPPAPGGERLDGGQKGGPVAPGSPSGRCGDSDGVLHVSFEEDRFPAYFVDNRLRVTWMNRFAEEKIFFQSPLNGEMERGVSLFKLLFHWRLHQDILNWKDLMRFHMAHAKAVHELERERLRSSYEGMTKSEAEVLEAVWDQVGVHGEWLARETWVQFLMRDGSTRFNKIHSMRFSEGTLFVVLPGAPF